MHVNKMTMNPLLRLVILLKPHLPLMLLGSLLAVITVIANISLLAISGWFISTMAIAGLAGITTNYFTPAAIIRFLAIVRTAGRYAERLLTHKATFDALASLRFYFYSRLEPLLPYYRQQLQSADLLARLQQDIDQLDNFYLRVLLPIFVAIFSVPIVCFTLGYLSATLAIVVALALIIVGLILPMIMLKLSNRAAHQRVQTSSQLKLELIDGMQAMREMLVYQMASGYQHSINRISLRYHAAEMQLHKYTAIANAVTFLVVNCTVIASLYLLIPQVQHNSLSPAFVASAALLILVCFETVMSMPLALQILPQVQVSAARLFEIIDKPLPPQSGTKAVQNGDILFDNLSFAFPDISTNAPNGFNSANSDTEKPQTVLRNISLNIAPAEKVAIIGASGAGKSTLANLLMGFWPVNPGQLSIHGDDINELSPESLRQYISLMNQQSYLFHATIADNLRLAKADATVEEMHQVLTTVGLIEFIEELDLGLKTWVGETGEGLSGGQSQRLKIAQALLRSSQVLALDEPTRGLDRHSEHRFIHNLLQHLQTSQQSLILITHKPLLLRQMDKIVVMDAGQIIAQGSHQQLLASNEYYRQLLNYF